MQLIHQIEFSALCFALLFLLCFWVWRMKSENLVSEKLLAGNWTLLHIRHAGGIIIMLALPAWLLAEFPDDFIRWPQQIEGIHLIAFAITAALLFLMSRKETSRIDYSKISRVQSSSSQIILYVLLRNGFLICYEIFFRGILLVSCIQLFGEAVAVLINISLYALIHSFNGKREILGTIPFGIVLCVFTIWWQSVLPAILLHILLSGTYESVILSHLFYKPSKLVA